MKKMKLKILVDNKVDEGFKAEWGFSCLVKGVENVLFDTRASSEVRSFNSKKFALKQGQIGKIVFSHVLDLKETKVRRFVI